MQATTSREPCAGRVAGRVIGRCDLRLWSLPQAERWRRSLTRAGVGQVTDESGPLPDADSLVLARADYVLDDGLIRALVATPSILLAVDRADGGKDPVAVHVPAARAAEAACILGGTSPTQSDLGSDLAVVGPDDLGARHNAALRKRTRPFAIKLTRDSLREAERLTFAGAYKGVTDLVTKYVWPAPARVVTRWAAAWGISPNMVTAASLALVLVALWLFASGSFWAGLGAAWVMTFLDTVDGKLARVTLTSSRWGNVFDHGIDLIHPPFWYWAWWYGLHAEGETTALWAVSSGALWVVVGGYVIGRLMEGFFIWRFGMEIHVWRPIDSLFRLITARRNPNLLLLTVGTALGRPDLGFGAIAVWTAASLAFHALRIVQAAVLKARGRPIISWLSEPAMSAST